MLERGRSGGTSPLPEPTRRIVFCESWNGSSPRYTRAAFWARGPVTLRLTTRAPVRTAVSVDGRQVVRREVAAPVRIGVGSAGWHLIGVRVPRTDRGLQVRVG